MAIADDFSVDTSGNIRYTGSGTNYTVLELHRFLQALADDEQASGDDLVDITSSTPSERSTDQIITLNSPYNIDDTAARHLYSGSISQNGGDDLYSGLQVLGTVVANTEILIVQDDKVLPAYWGTGINADEASATIMRLLVKSRSNGADIDGKKILVMARELGDQYKEFAVTLGLASSVAAISTSSDLNNTTAEATIEGWSTIANVEGFQEIDIDGNGTPEEYYAQFDKGSQTLNDVYEYSKWVTQRSHTIDSGTDTGTNYVVDNATITGQAQEFTANDKTEKITEMRFRIKIGAGTPTGTLVAKLIDSDEGSPAAPTGADLATSEPVLASLITSSYQTVIFRFNDNVTMTASQKYFAVLEHADGTAGAYFHVDGAASGAHGGNRAENSGGWAGDTNSDLWFQVKSSPVWHSRPGEKHRGITHEVVWDGGGGTFTEDEILFWGTDIVYDNLVGSFTVGEYVKFYDSGTTTVINGGKVLKDAANILTVALENTAGSILADGDHITGLSSGATADINGSFWRDDKAGGEGVLLALDDNTGSGDWYMQLISGAAPVNDVPVLGRASGASGVVNVTVTSRTISPEFIGQSTGTNLIGAYGIGFQTTDVGSSDKFFDLTNTQRTPPNNVTFTVTGLVVGEDRVLVGPRTGTSLEKGQWTLGVALTGAAETSIVILDGAESAPIATDTPSDGQTYNTRLRVELDSGIYRRQPYISYSGSTFTTSGTDYTGANVAASGNNVFCAYIDVLADASSEAYTAVYSTNRDIFVRVRDGGGTPIKTFEGTAAEFTSTNISIAATRTSDA